jgi:chorismate mutase
LIIESHIDPDNAWSDAKQQITPEKLGELIGSIIWRKKISLLQNACSMEKLRRRSTSWMMN